MLKFFFSEVVTINEKYFTYPWSSPASSFTQCRKAWLVIWLSHPVNGPTDSLSFKLAFEPACHFVSLGHVHLDGPWYWWYSCWWGISMASTCPQTCRHHSSCLGCMWWHHTSVRAERKCHIPWQHWCSCFFKKSLSILSAFKIAVLKLFSVNFLISFTSGSDSIGWFSSWLWLTFFCTFTCVLILLVARHGEFYLTDTGFVFNIRGVNLFSGRHS